MINLDNITNENNKKHNKKWPYIPDHPYRVLIIGGSESGKTNTLLNLINEQNDIDKIYLYAKDLIEPKHLSNVQIRWMMIMRIFMIIIQAEKEKSGLFLMISLQTL